MSAGRTRRGPGTRAGRGATTSRGAWPRPSSVVDCFDHGQQIVSCDRREPCPFDHGPGTPSPRCRTGRQPSKDVSNGNRDSTSRPLWVTTQCSSSFTPSARSGWWPRGAGPCLSRRSDPLVAPAIVSDMLTRRSSMSSLASRVLAALSISARRSRCRPSTSTS